VFWTSTIAILYPKLLISCLLLLSLEFEWCILSFWWFSLILSLLWTRWSNCSSGKEAYWGVIIDDFRFALVNLWWSYRILAFCKNGLAHVIGHFTPNEKIHTIITNNVER
jgi:hypothetical protein